MIVVGVELPSLQAVHHGPWGVGGLQSTRQYLHSRLADWAEIIEVYRKGILCTSSTVTHKVMHERSQIMTILGSFSHLLSAPYESTGRDRVTADRECWNSGVRHRRIIKVYPSCPWCMTLLGGGVGPGGHKNTPVKHNIYYSLQPAAPHLQLKICLAAGQAGAWELTAPINTVCTVPQSVCYQPGQAKWRVEPNIYVWQSASRFLISGWKNIHSFRIYDQLLALYSNPHDDFTIWSYILYI